MITALIVAAVLVWLLTGFVTGAVIAYNNLFIASWSWPGRAAVILLGPTVGVLTVFYFVGQFLAMLAWACIEPVREFVKG